jgi:hypothetical protein
MVRIRISLYFLLFQWYEALRCTVYSHLRVVLTKLRLHCYVVRQAAGGREFVEVALVPEHPRELCDGNGTAGRARSGRRAELVALCC